MNQFYLNIKCLYLNKMKYITVILIYIIDLFLLFKSKLNNIKITIECYLCKIKNLDKILVCWIVVDEKRIDCTNFIKCYYKYDKPLSIFTLKKWLNSQKTLQLYPQKTLLFYMIFQKQDLYYYTIIDLKEEIDFKSKCAINDVDLEYLPCNKLTLL